MKKYLLSLLIAGITFVGFSSAENYTFTYDGNIGYTPTSFTTDIPLNELNVEYDCGSQYCYLTIMDDSYNDICRYWYNGGTFTTCNSDATGTFRVGGADRSGLNRGNFNRLKLSEGQNNGGGEGGEGGQLVPGGIADFTPVITGLTNSINEFIPYVVYIGLGVLGVIVGFFAIKRLLKFVKGSSLSVFNSRRKK